MTLEENIRLLARSSYFQEIFSASQKCSGIYLFHNQTNFSGIQYLFFYWLRVYSMLYEELYSFEWENLDEEVIKDNDRCDAFLYWRRKEQEKKLREYKKEDRKSKKHKGNSYKVFSGAKSKKEGNK